MRGGGGFRARSPKRRRILRGGHEWIFLSSMGWTTAPFSCVSVRCRSDVSYREVAPEMASVQTLKSVSVFGPNVWVNGTSAASRPRAMSILA